MIYEYGKPSKPEMRIELAKDKVFRKRNTFPHAVGSSWLIAKGNITYSPYANFDFRDDAPIAGGVEVIKNGVTIADIPCSLSSIKLSNAEDGIKEIGE